MKKITILLATIFVLSTSTFAQATDEQKETKKLEVMGGLSAGYMYNTYITVGAVADAFVSEHYDKERTIALMQEQVSMIGSVAKMMQEMLDIKALKSQSDIDYTKEVIVVLKGLSLQAQYVIDVAEKKAGDPTSKYDKQRLSNWSKISALLGIDDEE